MVPLDMGQSTVAAFPATDRVPACKTRRSDNRSSGANAVEVAIVDGVKTGERGE
jgi:hypothetical protein